MSELYLPYNGNVKLTSRYGWRILNGVSDWHSGIDLVGLEDKRILAPCDGTVGAAQIITDTSNKTWEWGNYIRIDRPNGMRVYMCHLSQYFVSMGQAVKKGDVIGIEGATGYSFGSHCHFEVRINNISVDPTPYLGIANEDGLTITQASGTPGDGNTPHEWAKDAVEWCVQNGIMQGDSATKKNYRLNDPITREEFAVMLYRARGKL